MRWHGTILILLLLGTGALSLHVGLRLYSPCEVWAALSAPSYSPDDHIIRGLRVPRTAAALVVGAALGVSGLLMQAVLRNPLAEPGLLGVNAGASFAVVFALSVLGVTALPVLSVFALLGAAGAMAGLTVLVVLARGTLTPVSLLLAGVTIAALLNSLTQLLVVTDEGTMEAMLFWLAGGFADRDGLLLWTLSPALLLCIAFTYLSAPALNAMATGDATAHSLGVDTMRLRFIVLGLATFLAALSVLIAGPVGFVGLVAPHVARLMAGIHHGLLLWRTALIGASLACLADVAARRVVVPQEAPVTATLALVGAPVLVSLVRNRQLRAAA